MKKLICVIVVNLLAWTGTGCDNSNANTCIQTQPPKVVGGKISTPDPRGSERYTLFYHGFYKNSGRECRTHRRVTESEYNHRIYGHREKQ